MSDRTRPSGFYHFVGVVSWPLLHGVYRLRVRGLENVPRAGGLVLASNHTSNFDPWPLGMKLWPRRQLFFMAKSELFNPILAPILRAAGAFAVRRGQRDAEAIETAVRIAREGGAVVMFPEGTRRQKGLRKKFEPRPHTGAARIALAADVPLVPAAIKGTDRLLRLARLDVAYGPPIRLDDLRGLHPRTAAETATERLMEAISELHGSL